MIQRSRAILLISAESDRISALGVICLTLSMQWLNAATNADKHWLRNLQLIALQILFIKEWKDYHLSYIHPIRCFPNLRKV